MDHYIDKKNVVDELPTAMARHGYGEIKGDVTGKVQVLRLEALGPGVTGSVDSLLEKVFVVSVPKFQEKGDLRPVLRIMLASLIMYHEEVQRDACSNNAIVLCLNVAAKEACIQDHCFPRFSSELLLNEWSKLIKLDVKKQTMEHSLTTADMASIASAVNQTLHHVTELAAEREGDREEIVKKCVQELNGTVSFVEDLAGKMVAFQQTLDEFIDKGAAKLQCIRTPTHPSLFSGINNKRDHSQISVSVPTQQVSEVPEAVTAETVPSNQLEGAAVEREPHASTASAPPPRALLNDFDWLLQHSVLSNALGLDGLLQISNHKGHVKLHVMHLMCLWQQRSLHSVKDLEKVVNFLWRTACLRFHTN
jgi:hypothetical protein